MERTYNLTTIDAYDKVVPWFNRYIWILISQDLEPKGTVATVEVLGRRIGVEARYEAVERAKHFVMRGFRCSADAVAFSKSP